MKSKVLYIVAMLTIYLLESCNNQVQTVATAEFDTVSTYTFVTNYSNGNIKKLGRLQNMKKVGNWSEFYDDGTLRRKISYVNDSAQIPDHHIRFPRPRVIYEHDSLIVGRKTRIRVLSILPGEWLAVSNNIHVDSMADNSEFDYCITPVEEGLASFAYERRVLFDSVGADYKEMARFHNISEKEARKMFNGVYVKHNVPLDKRQIYSSGK